MKFRTSFLRTTWYQDAYEHHRLLCMEHQTFKIAIEFFVIPISTTKYFPRLAYTTPTNCTFWPNKYRRLQFSVWTYCRSKIVSWCCIPILSTSKNLIIESLSSQNVASLSAEEHLFISWRYTDQCRQRVHEIDKSTIYFIGCRVCKYRDSEGSRILLDEEQILHHIPGRRIVAIF